jgi:hypothetical protein
MAEPANPGDETKLWVSAFIILLLVSTWILVMRIMNAAFLALEFEAAIVYLPTFLAGMIAFYLSVKGRNRQA